MGMASIVNLSASIFEISRISLMMPSRDSAEPRDISSHSRLFATVESNVNVRINYAHDAVHRRPDFMAHIRQERAFGARRVLGALFGERQPEQVVPVNGKQRYNAEADA